MKPEKLYDNIHGLYDKRHTLAPSRTNSRRSFTTSAKGRKPRAVRILRRDSRSSTATGASQGRSWS